MLSNKTKCLFGKFQMFILTLYTVNLVIYAVILFMLIMRVVVWVHK